MLNAVYVVLYLFQGITAAMFMHLCLKPKYNKVIHMTVWGLASIWTPAGRMLQMANESTKPLILLSGIVLYLVICITLYQDPLWKRITAVLLTFVATLFADCICLVAFYIVDPSFLDANTGINLQTTIIAAAGEASMIVVYLIMLTVWNLISSKKLIVGYLPTLLLPVSQLCFSAGANIGLEGHSSMYTYAFFIGEVLGFVLDVYWMQELLYRSRRAEAQEMLRETKHQMELEQTHYREIESKREDMAKIRHDINNQISAVKLLIADGKNDVADDMLTKLSNDILATREYKYCAIPIVNAVISEKEEICRQKNIKLTVSLDIPAETGADNTELCSIFGNLLDNAIRGVDESSEKGEIKLSSITNGGYLVIKTVNPSDKPGKLREGHGYGSIIMKDIAEKHSGSYKTTYENNTFTAVVSMKVTE